MEAGKKRISASQLFALANYLDVPVAAFFDRREVSV
jgi:transcriptional regulator with XRE-family HTH domain